MQDEWLNSRGAIARFERNAIEIRIIDIQECPQADIAILALIVAVLTELVAESWQTFAKQAAWHEEELLPILLNTIKNGQTAVIDNTHYLQMFGYTSHANCTAGKLWQHLLDKLSGNLSPHAFALETILNQGNLAERITKTLKTHQPTPSAIQKVYQQLAQCLAANKLYTC